MRSLIIHSIFIGVCPFRMKDINTIFQGFLREKNQQMSIGSNNPQVHPILTLIGRKPLKEPLKKGFLLCLSHVN